MCIDPTTGNAIVELLRALMGAPPEFVHLVAITDYLILVHQASETYVTHSRHNMYFSLPTLEERKSTSRVSSVIAGSSSDESISAFENSKLTKALRNVQVYFIINSIYASLEVFLIILIFNIFSIYYFTQSRFKGEDQLRIRNVTATLRKKQVVVKILELQLVTVPTITYT